MNGARIVNKPVTVKGNKKSWMIGNNLSMMKSQSSVGVGYVFEDSSSSDDNVCLCSSLHNYNNSPA